MEYNNIERHTSFIENRLNKIPDFIDTKKDLELWDMVYFCNYTLLDLIDFSILNNDSLEIVTREFIQMKKYIEVIVEPKKFFLIELYFVVILEFLLEYCESNELFEACVNIKSFEKLIEKLYI